MNRLDKCLICRWWHGDRADYAGAVDHGETGTCDRIHAGGGRREAMARIFPIGAGAWLETHRDFSLAVLVSHGRHGTKPEWIPLSECQVEPIAGRTGRVWNDDRREWAPVVVVTLPEWLAREKGLI